MGPTAFLRRQKEQTGLLFYQIPVDPAHIRKISVLRDGIASSQLWSAQPQGSCSNVYTFHFTLCTGDTAAVQVATDSGHVGKKKKEVWAATKW